MGVSKGIVDQINSIGRLDAALDASEPPKEWQPHKECCLFQINPEWRFAVQDLNQGDWISVDGQAWKFEAFSDDPSGFLNVRCFR